MAYDPSEECTFLTTELKEGPNIPVSFTDRIKFHAELYCIMHAFGDVKVPLESSVKLMHNILQNQMALLIKNAENVMKRRKGKTISHQDILFQMRRNKVLLKRLLQFLFVEDTKVRLVSNIKQTDGEFLPENGERVSKCLKYLGFIEKFAGDLTTILKNKSIVDHENIKRLKRKDLMANSMTQKEYEHFNEYTKRVSFCYKNAVERFTIWLQQSSGINVDIKPLALSIIHFLSRETVARIVDKALEVKSRKHHKSDNFSLESFTHSKDMLPELGQDLDRSENNHSLNRTENWFELGESENNLQFCSHDIPEASSDIKNSNSRINYAISMNTRSENVFLEKNRVKPKNSTNSKQDFNYSSKRKKSSHLSIFNKNLSENAETDERNCNKYDNLKNGCFFNTYCVAKKDKSSIVSSKSKTNQVYSDALLKLPNASKYINKESYFSLNFQEKELSICYDGVRTFEYHKNSAPKRTLYTEDEVLASSCSIEYIDSEDVQTEDSILKNSVDFDKSFNHVQFAISMKMDSQVHWFPNEAITPEEIQTAFICYQHSSPVSYFMKTVHRKTNLVCLASPDYFHLN